tara:strand:+ start:6769 stop:7011 length:243 start_codon:yes stop_codon:yes gene_type:complete
MGGGMTWFVIGAVTAVYLQHRYSRSKQETEPCVVLDSSNEPDLTRWRHTGQQHVAFKDGNRPQLTEVFPAAREIKQTLGF